MENKLKRIHRHSQRSLITAILFSFAFISIAYASQASGNDQPGFLSLLPPIVAISLALILKEVIVSLLMGLFVGTLLITSGNPLQAFINISTDFIWNALADKSHAAVVLFSLMLAGMVGILSKSGGTAGIVNLFGKFAARRRGGLLMTYFLGILIFFDDYANTLLVGHTMRPFTDRLKISRAKLAYIVDSTAAPVVSIAVVSTWIGFEVGLIRDAIEPFHGIGDAYILFLKAIPYHFYSIFALLLVLILISWDRDWGSMKSAEIESFKNNDWSKSKDVETIESHDISDSSGWKALIALIPISLVIISTFSGLILAGKAVSPAGASLSEIIGQADSSMVLMASAFIGLISAGLLAAFIGKQPVEAISSAMMNGYKSMVPAMVILILAWSLGDVCDRIGTAPYLINAVSGVLSPSLIPVTIFLVSAIVAFSTGTSWGAMAILIPIAIPLAIQLPIEAGIGADHASRILLGSVGAVLAGATFGDHCSPISDTTIMSSMAAGCDHVAHVHTQIPYALLAGFIAILTGYLPAGFGLPGWIGLLTGIVILGIIPKFFRKDRIDSGV